VLLTLGQEAILVPANPSLPLLDDLIPCPWSLSTSGLWIATATTDVVAYNQAVDREQQLYAIGHQVTHLLLRHEAVPSAAASQALFPRLNPSLVAAVIAVSRFAPADERAADEFASLVAAHALSARRTQVRPS
jgi:hypothetical protein